MDKKRGNPNRSKNLWEDMANSMTVESFFSTYVLLDTFLSNEFIDKAKSLHVRMANRHAQEGVRQGYKLLLIAALHNYIDEIIRSPEVIGIEPDLDYRDYWVFTKGRGREITRAIARTDHHVSRFVAKAISFINEILTLETWENIETFSEKTKSFRNCLRQISEKAYVASKGNVKVAMRDALLESSNMILWSNYDNPLPIAHWYTDYFISGRGSKADLHSLDEMLEECHISSGTTRLDFSRIDPTFFPRPLPAHWALGYAFSLHESLKLMARNEKQRSHLISLDELVFRTKNWSDVDKYGRKITTIYGLPKIFRGYSYSDYLEITDDNRQPLMAEVGNRHLQKGSCQSLETGQESLNEAPLVPMATLHVCSTEQSREATGLKRQQRQQLLYINIGIVGSKKTIVLPFSCRLTVAGGLASMPPCGGYFT